MSLPEGVAELFRRATVEQYLFAIEQQKAHGDEIIALLVSEYYQKGEAVAESARTIADLLLEAYGKMLPHPDITPLPEK